MRTLLLLTIAAVPVAAQSPYVSSASKIVGTYEPAKSDHSPKAMADAADAFLASLDDAGRAKAQRKLSPEGRREWTNLPARPDADGIRMADLSEKQIKAACDMMAALFSKQGYLKMRNIMLADDQLLRNGRPRSGFGTENFAIVIFGKPTADKAWGFQLDGHHVGVNVAIQGEKLSMSPSFIGTQPEAFKIATTAFRPFAGETDDAYKLLNSLNEQQKSKAVIGNKRGRINYGPGADGKPPRAMGVSCATFNAEQRKALIFLLGQWVNDLPPRQAKARMAKLEKEIDKMSFAWSGPTAPKSDISYYVMGPSVILEYACQDLGGNPLAHLHSMYRDPTNEYGGQMK